MTGKDSVDIFSILDPQSGDRIARPYLTPRQDQREKNVYTRVPAVIPVVFLPGIMGTNLKIKGKQDTAWRPPNAVVEGLASVAVWMWRGPKTRQGRLNMKAVEVDFDGPIEVGSSGLSSKLARERGWGSAMKSAYHPVLALLQQRLNAMASFSAGAPLKAPPAGGFGTTVDEQWRTIGMRPPGEYGEQRGLAALTEAEITQAARYSYDIWCGGYNWLQSNRDSGKDIQDYIENTVLAHYRKKNIPAKKVILVTHSMGGLVSRALTEIHNYPHVLGVVSGVQPATGAPTIYHHMRCGYEGAEQVILGRNAGEVTAVVGNAPGALELAPTFDHDNGKPWLFITGAESSSSIQPKGDPYTNIYMNPAWYGLVPESNSKYLDLSADSTADAEVSQRHNFKKTVTLVRSFHTDISKKYHSETYAHYGADERLHSWQTVHWKGEASRLQAGGFKDDENGSYVMRQQIGDRGQSRVVTALELAPGKGSSGDGTVAETSGVAPGAAHAKASFRHGNLGKGAYNKAEGYGHQPSYTDERAQWATLYSIVKIAQEADWHAG